MNRFAWRKTMLNTVMLAAVLSIFGCHSCLGPNLQGTYTDASGAFKLELQSGGKATLTTLNSPTACTYKADGKQLTVLCENQTLPFTIQDDGSLMPPAEAQLGPLKKAKP